MLFDARNGNLTAKSVGTSFFWEGRNYGGRKVELQGAGDPILLCLIFVAFSSLVKSVESVRITRYI